MNINQFSGLVIRVCLFLFMFLDISAADQDRVTIDLNGTWDFEQTKTAFPPEKFTRKIPVPGLIHMAEPKVDQYDTFFARPDTVQYGSGHNVLDLFYEPRYNWYQRQFTVSKNLQDTQAVLTILKSKYVTQAFVNGIEVGQSIACYTPIEFPITHALKFGKENEIVVRVGDRAWLPSAAAGSTDNEKVNYLPGIWDNVSVTFTGQLRINRSLVLPSVVDKKVTVKLLIRSFYPAQTIYSTQKSNTCNVEIKIREAKSSKLVAKQVKKNIVVMRDKLTETAIDIPVNEFQAWTPDNPFLYCAEITLYDKDLKSDNVNIRFGMRNFKRVGKHFALNGRKIMLRGTNVTLHRFFEDPDCAALPWDRKWVKKLLADIPKRLHWNAMRICVGIAPSLWYEIADEEGLLLQNEWLYWQNHGWDEQIKAEYTNWVWSDGNHPAIVIWDAINENWDPYIGNVLIPELKKLDNTRIWDAGYMTSEHMGLDEMDEPHPYCVKGKMRSFKKFKEQLEKNPYPLGDLHYWPENRQNILESSAAQLVNEYGWMWLWRDGNPAKLMIQTFRYYIGENHTTQQRRFMQAYWVQLQTEWLRTERSLAGVLAFCYLTNNYGYTGDWFINNIADLQHGLTLDWFAHCFAPAAVFIDLLDQRYNKHVLPFEPGSNLSFNLVGVNDEPGTTQGQVSIRLLDEDGKEVLDKEVTISIPGYLKRYLPVNIPLPEKPGGYLLLAEFTPDTNPDQSPIVSRRYIKIGAKQPVRFFDYRPSIFVPN